jgi:Zn-dependent protease
MPFNTGNMQNMILYYAFRLLTIVPVLLIALPFHECAHGYVAYLLGDDTAKRQGRLTLNPIRHLDPIGSICILFFGIGWAKPVPVNPYNFKNRKLDMAVTSIAGPLSNLLLAFFSLLLLAGGLKLTGSSLIASNLFVEFVVGFAQINILLCIFNLIPIPPFDGSRLLALFLPENALASFERFGSIPALIIIFLFWNRISGPIINLTSYILTSFANFLHL